MNDLIVRQTMILNKSAFRFNLKFFLVVGMSLVCFEPAFASPRTCGGCKELRALKQELQIKLKESPKAQFPVVEKISKKFSELPRSAEGTLDHQQIKLMIEILQLARDEGFRLELLEANEPLLRDNRDAFAAQLAKLEGNDSKQILRDIDSIIMTRKYGQEPPKDIVEKLGPPPGASKSVKPESKKK